MPILLSNLRQSFRSLLRAPGFASLAVLVLALGLGANLLLFNAVQALLWRPLPFPEQQRLVCLITKHGASEDLSATGLQTATLKEQAGLLAEVGLAENFDWDAPLQDQAERRLSCGVASSGYFRALGLRPLVGRLFDAEEDRGGGGETHAVITEAAWRRVFGADPSIVGRQIRLGSGPVRGPIRILGVIAGEATLPFTSGAQMIFPIETDAPKVRQDDSNGTYTLLARLKPGVAREQALAQVTAALTALPERGKDRYWLVPLRKILQPDNQGFYMMLLGASGLLLLLTATNAASLFLARALEHSRDTALRLALGAGLPQLLRTQVLEAGLVCGAGLILAFGLNALMKAPLLVLLPELRRMGPELLDSGPVLLGFALLMTAVVCLAVCMLPLLQARGQHLARYLAKGGRFASGGRHRGRSILVTAQVAVILVLLSLGALLTRSLGRALGQGLGFDPQGVQVCNVAISQGESGAGDLSLPHDRNMGGVELRAELADLAASIPGTSCASFVWRPPFGSGRIVVTTASHEGEFRPEDPPIPYSFIGPGYFQTLGAQMLSGREFSRAEVVSGASVAVLNESSARRLFHGADPLGKVIHSGIGNKNLTVVGVCRDLRSERLDKAPGPMVYHPYLSLFGQDEAVLLVKTHNSGAFASALRERLKTLNSGARLDLVQPLMELGTATVRERVRAASMVGSFALLGLCIGCIGLYGTLSAQSAERKREVGIRVALGSTALAAATRILAKGIRPVILGAILGLGAALMAARLVRAQLYGVEAMDATSYLAAIGLLALGSLLAFLVPILRASRVDPAVVLREE